MALIDWSWGESYASPTLSVIPQHPTAGFSHPTRAFGLHWQTLNCTQPTSSSMQPQQSHHRTSRKRSRDEMSDGYEHDDSDSSRASTTPFPSARPTPSPPKIVHQPENPLLDPGMTLAYPCSDGDDLLMTGSQLDAASQTGTWAEELSERLRSSSMREQQQMQHQPQPRPTLESRKSMRLDREAINQKGADGASSSTSTPMSLSTQPTPNPDAIDEASVTLGIGWSSIPSNSTMDAASRGWARHIEAHFPLQNVRIVWMNKSLPAYLVSAVTCDGRERQGSPSPSPQPQLGSAGSRSPSPWSIRAGYPGYYLFDETFGQGRLVAKSWGRALQNLRCAPLVFEGPVVMESAEALVKPKPIRAHYWAGWGMRTGGTSISTSAAASSSSATATTSPSALVSMEAADAVGESMDLDM